MWGPGISSLSTLWNPHPRVKVEGRGSEQSLNYGGMAAKEAVPLAQGTQQRRRGQGQATAQGFWYPSTQLQPSGTTAYTSLRASRFVKCCISPLHFPVSPALYPPAPY